MSIIENIKDTVKMIQTSDNIELVQKLLSVQQEAIDILEQIRRKNEIIHKLQEDLKQANIISNIKSRTKKIRNCYYEFNIDKPIGGPYCPTCLDNGRISHIVSKGRDKVKCPKCGIEFADSKAVYYINNGNLDGEYESKKISLSELQRKRKSKSDY